MKIITRKEAQKAGSTKYFTGKPCPKGHITERQTSTGTCVGCKKAWAENNPDYQAERYWSDPDKAREKSRVYRRESAYDRRRYQANKQSEMKRAANWRKTNRARANAINAARRAVRHNALPSWFGEFDLLVISEASELSAQRTRETGTAWHVDHMVPLQAKTACGLHCANNIQVIPAAMNASKRNKLIFIEPNEWIRNSNSAIS